MIVLLVFGLLIWAIIWALGTFFGFLLFLKSCRDDRKHTQWLANQSEEPDLG